MRKFFLLFFTISSFLAFCQNDCSDAIIVCGNSGYSNIEVEGFGKQELVGNTTCDWEEDNSIWFKLNIVSSGTLAFTLTPSNPDPTEIFDFFIFGPNATCDNLGTTIRCQSSDPDATQTSVIGLRDNETDVKEGPGGGVNVNGFLKSIDAKAGESYFLVVNRYKGSSDFKIDWTGTAQFSSPPVIDPTLSPNKTFDLEECDIDNDEVSNFNLSKNDFIVNGQANTIISYHKSNSDAVLDKNPIDTSKPYTNKTNPERIYFRLTNTKTNCYTTDYFELKLAELKAYPVSNYTICDNTASGDPNDGFIKGFILNSKDSEVLNKRNPKEFKISYHKSKADAETNSNSINKNLAFENTQSFSQNIYVRLEELKTGCTNTTTSFKLIVNTPTKIKTSVTLKQCDNDNDGLTTFNLSEAKQLISKNTQNFSFTFYKDKTSAENNTTLNQITDFENYKNSISTNESVWVSVTNKNGCSSICEIKLLVTTTQVPQNFIINYEQCDTPNNDNTFDGISTFNISDAVTKIKKLFPLQQDLIVNFYETEVDALTEKNKITNLSNYSNNKSAYTQFIYVRVESTKNNACIGLGKFIKLTVKTPPEFTIISPGKVCINNPMTNLKTNITDNKHTYTWIKNKEVIANSPLLPIESGGTYFITITNKKTGCSTTKSIKIEERDLPKITDKSIVFNEKSGLYDVEIINFYKDIEFDTFEYALKNENDEFIKDYEATNTFNNLQGGIYTLLTKNKCGVTPYKFYTLQIPNYFSPNNDGVNDKWIIKGLNSSFFPIGNITILDRYGRVLSKYGTDKNQWDGTYNNKPLPTGDYWYILKLTNPKNETIEKLGHFSIIRE